MADPSDLMRQSSGLDPQFLLPRPKIRRRTIRKSSPQIPVGDDVPEDIDSENFIQCINCLDTVSGEVIDAHRKVCSTFVEINISSEGALQSNQSQVLKFSRYLENLLKNPCLSSSDAHLIGVLQKSTESLNQTVPDYSATTELHESIKALWETYKGKANLRIIIERFIALIKTQINILQHGVVEERKNKLKNMKNKLNRLRHMKPTTSTNELKVDKGKIEEINSQIKSKKASSGKFSESEAPSDNKNTYPLREEPPENFQHYFYGICLEIKMQMDTYSPAQAVPISFLYEKANKERVQAEDWHRFVREQLANPENWARASVKKPPIMRIDRTN